MATPSSGTKKRKADDSSNGKTKKFRTEFSATITVIVRSGDLERTLTVHEDLICSRSDFFKAACSATWANAAEKVVKLPHSNSRIFRLYLEWIYAKGNDLAGLVRSAVKEIEDRAVRDFIYQVLCWLWVLADYLGDRGCKNEVIDTLIRDYNCNSVGVSTRIMAVVEREAQGSDLERVMIDMAFPVIMRRDSTEFVDKCPPAWVAQWFKKLLPGKNAVDRQEAVNISEACKYHEHAEGEDRCSETA
ncbi:hypothetical protein LTR37_017494 [Vermiconidia calcicola]|uniref:Uncharacterized protein n=1 Tax=Vermiconidia calcicola TaxID=1690605 RepID=A0ACC3MKI9_9PEZI|nr:hypothetical protein LTR37_017494 [Vermiconidia calcicola]